MMKSNAHHIREILATIEGRSSTLRCTRKKTLQLFHHFCVVFFSEQGTLIERVREEGVEVNMGIRGRN
jgi:hypothetical protein